MDYHVYQLRGWSLYLDQGEIADFTLHWRLTRADDGNTDVLQGQGKHTVESMVDVWRLQDNIVCSCPRPLEYVFKIKDDYSPMTKVLLALLGRIATSAAAFEKPTMFAGEKGEGG